MRVGLENVRVDQAGNVVGERRGASQRPHLMIAAHLDTCPPPETNVKVSRDGAVLRGPGIADNCRGLAVLVAIARALNGGRRADAGFDHLCGQRRGGGPGRSAWCQGAVCKATRPRSTGSCRSMGQA